MTFFDIATVLSYAILAVFGGLFIYLWRRPYKSSNLLTPTRLFAVGVALAAFVMFLPHYFAYATPDRSTWLQIWETVWASVHHAVRLFVVDTAMDDVASFATHDAYAFLGTVLYILAPIMTAGVLLSFFKNFFAYTKCFFHPRRDVYIFSELSEKSLALATDLSKNHKKALIVFTDVFEKDDEENYEIRERVKEIGAICLQKDITTIGTLFRARSAKIHLFAISEDEGENVKQAFALSRTESPYATRENVFLYVFSSEVQSELLMDNIPSSKMRVRRINDIRSLVWHDLYVSGENLFHNAIPEENGIRCIRAVIIGTGGHGTEMIKALSWFCQMEGYRVEIHAFDKDENAEARFKLLAPDLMNPANNGVYIPGEPRCKIEFHSGVSVDTDTFTEELLKAGVPSFVFVSMGNDPLNVRTAVLLRQFYLQQHMGTPAIRAIVYEPRTKQALVGAKNWKNQEYHIDFIGDLEESYSEEVILRQALEDEALKTHMGYGGTAEEFYRYEYNYRSSMASALHYNLRKKLGICYFTDSAEALSAEDLNRSEVLEHMRWNAYMRSDGYVYSGSGDKSSRNDLAKMHHNLLPFEKLSEEDKRKDSAVALRK